MDDSGDNNKNGPPEESLDSKRKREETEAAQTDESDIKRVKESSEPKPAEVLNGSPTAPVAPAQGSVPTQSEVLARSSDVPAQSPNMSSEALDREFRTVVSLLRCQHASGLG